MIKQIFSVIKIQLFLTNLSNIVSSFFPDFFCCSAKFNFLERQLFEQKNQLWFSLHCSIFNLNKYLITIRVYTARNKSGIRFFVLVALRLLQYRAHYVEARVLPSQRNLLYKTRGVITPVLNTLQYYRSLSCTAKITSKNNSAIFIRSSDEINMISASRN